MAQTPKILAAALAISFLLAGCTDALGDKYISFSQCLTDKNTVMYGAYWCPHCANQKKPFGKEGFKKINYVECDPRGANAQPELCKQKDIKSYPTWIFSDGSRLFGEVPLEKLAEKTQCALPAEGAALES